MFLESLHPAIVLVNKLIYCFYLQSVNQAKSGPGRDLKSRT